MRKSRIGMIALILCLILVAIPVSAEAKSVVKLNKSKVTMYVSNSMQLKLSGTAQKATWSSTDRNIATVNKHGRVLALKSGRTTIKAKVKGKTYRCQLTVKKPYLNTTKKTIDIGKGFQLKLTGVKAISFISSQKAVASVSKTGKVIAKKAGTTTITVKGNDMKKYSCKVNVRKKETSDPAPETEKKTLVEAVVGEQHFVIHMYENQTAKAFVEKLPMTIMMDELNGNEKYYYMEESLQPDAQRVAKIQTGDLKLFGSDCLVLFYESFSTSYRYTSLGYMEDTSGLTKALGTGSVKVTFQLSK